jgi:6-phospho-beta-glucosidase
MRLVVLGGSGSSTPELFDALSDWPGGRIDPSGPAIGVEISAGRRDALRGADVVLNQVRVGGYAARAFDESFPWAFGLPGEETIGPGGFANACRTLPVLAETWDDVAQIAPNALVVNLTNPAGIVQTAAHRSHPGLNVVSVCDAPMPMLAAIAERLDRPLGQVRQRYVGMNHVGWYVRLHEALPAPYVRYYVHPDRILAAQQGNETRAQTLQKLDATLLAGYGAGASDLPRRGAVVWYRMAVATLIDGWVNGTDDAVIAGVRNGGRIPSLPDDAVLELSHAAPRPGTLVASPPAPLPSLPAALLSAHAGFEVLAAEGAARGGRDERLRALVANPLVRSVDQAIDLLDAISQDPNGRAR